MTLRLKTPLGEADARKLRAGDSVLLTGVIYTARDAAHKRLCELVEAGKPLPFDPMDAVVYYVGPTPAAPGQIIGSAGPTTSYRMDAYAPTLIALGLRGMIGKGRRNAAVIASMKQHGAVYFGAEALRRLEVEDFPVTVIIDALGNDLYETGRRAYLEQCNGKQPH